jgi:hypothetical protein
VIDTAHNAPAEEGAAADPQAFPSHSSNAGNTERARLAKVGAKL